MPRMISFEVYRVMQGKFKTENFQSAEEDLLGTLATGHAVSINDLKNASRDYTKSITTNVTLNGTLDHLFIRFLEC